MKKKLLSFTLIFLLLCSFPITGMAEENVPGGDDAAEGDGLDEYLVIHYDFQGADILEAMEDKATAGSVADDLQPIKGKVNFSGLEVDPTNGTIKNTANDCGVFCPPSDDTKVSSSGNNTWFVRFRMDPLDSSTGDYIFIVEMRTFGSSSVRPFAIQYKRSTNRLYVSMSDGESPEVAQNFPCAQDFPYDPDVYINMAVTVSKDAENKYVGVVHTSTGLPKTEDDWTELFTFTIGDSIAQPGSANNLWLMSNGSVGCVATVVIDDVRLYNKALTLTEIQNMFVNGSFEGQLRAEEPAGPEETDETNDETTTQTPESSSEPQDSDEEMTPTDTLKEETDAPEATTAGGGCQSTVAAVFFCAAVAGAGVLLTVGKKKR